VEGHGHGLLDFHAPTKTLLNLHVLVTKGLKVGFRRLVDGSGFEKMRVATLNMIIIVTNPNLLAPY